MPLTTLKSCEIYTQIRGLGFPGRVIIPQDACWDFPVIENYTNKSMGLIKEKKIEKLKLGFRIIIFLEKI